MFRLSEVDLMFSQVFNPFYSETEVRRNLDLEVFAQYNRGTMFYTPVSCSFGELISLRSVDRWTFPCPLNKIFAVLATVDSYFTAEAWSILF